MNASAIIPLDQNAALNAVAALKMLVYRLRNEQMIDGTDYGTIPGTNDKPTLLLPGMEKLMRGLNVVPVYTERRIIVDYDKPLFHYEYECRLVDAESGIAVPGGLAIGLATSYESKWRWRWVNDSRLPFHVDKASLETRNGSIREPAFAVSKKETSGKFGKPMDYWQRFEKAIEDGTAKKVTTNKKDGGTMDWWEIGGLEYRIPNVDIFDQLNTICKIAQKRALSSAIKGAAAVSEFFTVDLEDYNDQIITVTAEVVEDGKSEKPAASNITNIDVARQTLGSGSVERRAPYETPKTNGSAALDPLPVALNAWASKDTIQDFGTKCREATGLEDMSPPDVARLGLDNDTQFFAYKSWNETYPTMQHAIDFIKAAFEAEMTAKPATPATEPISANEAAIFGPAPEADF